MFTTYLYYYEVERCDLHMSVYVCSVAPNVMYLQGHTHQL